MFLALETGKGTPKAKVEKEERVNKSE